MYSFNHDPLISQADLISIPCSAQPTIKGLRPEAQISKYSSSDNMISKPFVHNLFKGERVCKVYLYSILILRGRKFPEAIQNAPNQLETASNLSLSLQPSPLL